MCVWGGECECVGVCAGHLKTLCVLRAARMRSQKAKNKTRIEKALHRRTILYHSRDVTSHTLRLRAAMRKVLPRRSTEKRRTVASHTGTARKKPARPLQLRNGLTAAEESIYKYVELKAEDASSSLLGALDVDLATDTDLLHDEDDDEADEFFVVNFAHEEGGREGGRMEVGGEGRRE